MFLGIDTSNYTTSVAAFIPSENRIINLRELLRVKPGELGLRQNEALFQHTAALPGLLEKLFSETLELELTAVSYSDKPRDEVGSYMPCFLAGECAARAIAAAKGCSLYRNSHQAGHIAAALFSAGNLSLIDEPFIAFHVSGGTTEALFVSPDSERIISTEIAACTLDLNAGQAIDRVGVALGLDFPCGKKLDEMACSSGKSFAPKIKLKDGSCCLSGLENLAKKMILEGSMPQEIARFCIDYISETLRQMVYAVLEKHGSLPLVFSGGVMSNSIISKSFTDEFGAVFARSEFSCDNAAGTAILGYIKHMRSLNKDK